MMKKYYRLISFILAICLLFTGCGEPVSNDNVTKNTSLEVAEDINEDKEEYTEGQYSFVVVGEIPEEDENETEYILPLEAPADETINKINNVSFDVPSFSVPQIDNIASQFASIKANDVDAYVVINNNIPYFSEAEKTTEAFEYYSMLDSLGRVSVAYANLSKEMMPAESRGSIQYIKPTGWHLIRYDDRIEDKYLYNRCHLIGYQFTGCNDVRNLMTGTRYFNICGMLPFENKVANYLRNTNNHVLYRVTPVFEGDNLLADGVLMEAYSVEDNGKGICFNVFTYNVQPGVIIDYSNGNSEAAPKCESNKLLGIVDIVAGIVTVSTASLVKLDKEEFPGQENVQEFLPNLNQEKIIPKNPVIEVKELGVTEFGRTTKQKSGNSVTVPTERETGENLVWVPTKGGTKYHKWSGCSNMIDPIQVNIDTAIANGYKPCKHCYK